MYERQELIDKQQLLKTYSQSFFGCRYIAKENPIILG